MGQESSPLTRVRGFRAVGVTCGLKRSGKPDMALVLSEVPCTAAAMFTTNAFKAAPVLYDMALMARTEMLRGVIINAGNANAVTGRQGMRAAEQMARLTEQACDLPPDSVAVMSTGIIGELMPMDKIKRGINQASELITTAAGMRGENVTEAIMTTDLVPKVASAEATVNGHTVRLAGMAKGSGMIEPNLATMLAVLVTDAALAKNTLDAALRRAVARSFNRLTVDGDTSTNDTVLLLASGQSGAPSIEPDTPGFELFVAALTQLSTDLAQAIARDGEGATKLVEITVVGAASEAEAERAAKTVATSPLVKTAIFGADPNWGRVLMAVGRSGVQVDTGRAALRLGEFQLVAQGEPLPFDVLAANEWLVDTTDVPIWIDLGVGRAEATVWTCDLSYRYVEINAEYHT